MKIVQNLGVIGACTEQGSRTQQFRTFYLTNELFLLLAKTQAVWKQTECSPEEKDLEILVNKNPNLIYQHVLTTPSPGLHQSSMVSRWCVSTPYSCLTRLHLEYFSQVWGTHYNKYVDTNMWRPWGCSEGCTTSGPLLLWRQAETIKAIPSGEEKASETL